MTLSLMTNISSMKAQNQLSKSSSELQGAMEHLSTGKQINRASDDAAGYAIAVSEKAQLRIFSAGMDNANEAKNLLAVKESATNSTVDALLEMITLATKASTASYSGGQRADYNDEFSSLAQSIIGIANGTSFNGINLMDGSAGTLVMTMGGASNTNIDIDLTTDFTSLRSLADDILTAGMTDTQASSYTISASAQMTTATAGWTTLGGSLSAGTAASNAVVASAASVVSLGGTAQAVASAAATWFTNAANTYGFTSSVATAFTAAAEAYATAAHDMSDMKTAAAAGGSASTGAAYDAGSTDWGVADAAASAAITAAWSQALGGSTGAAKAIEDLTADIQVVTTNAAIQGATYLNLEQAAQNIEEQYIALSEALGSLEDTDFAKGTQDSTRLNILMQAGVTVLSQANQAPQMILKLLG